MYEWREKAFARADLNLLILYMFNSTFSLDAAQMTEENTLCFNPCWTRIYPVFANSVDPDQLASSEANWSGSALFAIMWLYSNNPDQVIRLAEN